MPRPIEAVLEHHGTRPGDGAGHRAIAIKRVAADLGLAPAEQSVLGRLHDIRNRLTYRQSLPPITRADADAMQVILDKMLPVAAKLISP